MHGKINSLTKCKALNPPKDCVQWKFETFMYFYKMAKGLSSRKPTRGSDCNAYKQTKK